MSDLMYVGKSLPRVDALEKATGAAKYTSEEGLRFPGMLYGKVLYSPHAHAKILSIDTSRAKRVTGVKAVFTGADVPEHRAGVIIDDRHVLCKERVRFAGDAVAVVAANTVEAAEEAIDLIDVEYEVLPAIFDVEEAMKPGCPIILHPDMAKYNRPVYKYLADNEAGPNVHTHHRVRKGNVEEAFSKAYLVVEQRFQNDRMTHCQLEPLNCVVYPENDGTYTMWTSGRLYQNLLPVARAFNIPANRIRTRVVYLGGMFGHVARPERFGILIALKTGKPVKIVYSREECFVDGLNRLPKVVYVKDGVSKDGILLARQMKVIVNTGGYTNLAPMTIRNGSFHASQYRLPTFRWDAYGVYTNEPSCGPLRGFGSAEVLWATEQMMDIMAHKLGMDPAEYRLKNTPDEGETNVRGELVHSIGAKEALKKVTKWIEWGKPSEQPKESYIKVGKGIAIGNKYTQADTASAALVKVHSNGIIEVRHGTDEAGQGCNTVFTQIAAESFKVTPDKIKIIWGDTAIVPYDFGAASSRSTLYVGNAVLRACEDAKRQLFELTAPLLETKLENLDTKDGKIFVKNVPSKSIPFSALFLGAQPDARGVVKDAYCLPDGGEIIGKATFWGHPSEEDPTTGTGTKLTMSYCYGAQAIEVAVDTETGVVKILRFASAFDTGRPVNPKMCEGQMESGMAMGIGSGLWEGYIFSDKGVMLNPNFHDYKISSATDVPSGKKQITFIVEDPHKEGPFGAKGMGEAAMNPTAPAISNAIYNACGARVHHLPMTPERVLKAIKEANKAKEGKK